MATAQNPDEEVTTDAPPTSEPKKFVLRLKGPKMKVGQLPQVTHRAFPVLSQRLLIEVPINGEPVEVTKAQYEIIIALGLPPGYAWLDERGAEIVFGTEGQRLSQGDVPEGQGETKGDSEVPETLPKNSIVTRPSRVGSAVSGTGATPASEVSTSGAIGGESATSTSGTSTASTTE